MPHEVICQLVSSTHFLGWEERKQWRVIPSAEWGELGVGRNCGSKEPDIMQVCDAEGPEEGHSGFGKEQRV